jgi:tRNA (cmo5U34)-methyltransferase
MIQADFRTAELGNADYDVVLAAAVLHHLRDEEDWRIAFEKIHRIVAPGGSVWITDLVSHENEAIQSLMWSRYGQYLTELGGTEYRDGVFEYIDREDSPRSLGYQLNLLKQVGFDQVEVLHTNCCFAAFGAIRRR